MRIVSPLATICAVALFVAAPPAAHALVNPKFTVVDLQAASSAILQLQVSPPKDGKLTARVEKTVYGKGGKQKKGRTLTLDFSKSELGRKEISAAFRDANSAVGMLFVRKEPDEYGDTVGSLQIGTTWMGLIRTGDGAWDIVRDPDDLETVWAGSASQLRRAVQYVLDDASAEFPVNSGLSWAGSRRIATFKKPVRGRLVTGDGVIILSDGGDRVFQPGSARTAPTDITDQLNLTTRSRAMASADFNGDGRADLASWDGQSVWLVLRESDGTFSSPTKAAELADCRSLTTVAGGLVAAGDEGVTLLEPDGKGGLTARRLPGPLNADKLGSGGAAAVADFNDDGRPDVLHVYDKGVAFYRGTDDKVRFARGKLQVVGGLRGAVTSVCGDFDADGRPGVMVGGDNGVTLLSRNAEGRWVSAMHETGELDAAVGVGRTQTSVSCLSGADLRGDGRQSVAVFSPQAAVGLFYARGFRCFAIAIGLTRSQETNNGYDALSGGQQTGVVTDLNGDLSPDVLAVAATGDTWMLTTEPDRARRFALTAEAPAGGGPMTVRVLQGKRLLGVHVFRPGQPRTLVFPRAGRVTLSWKMPGGRAVSRSVVVTRHVRIEPLTPEEK